MYGNVIFITWDATVFCRSIHGIKNKIHDYFLIVLRRMIRSFIINFVFMPIGLCHLYMHESIVEPALGYIRSYLVPHRVLKYRNQSGSTLYK